MSKGGYRTAVVVGGGFYGCLLATRLPDMGIDRVVLLEREAKIFQRASSINQARVHNGYHYPHSFLTALRSRVNFPRFIEDYRDCIDDSFTKVYAVGKLSSNVTAQQFKCFCERIGAPLRVASPNIREVFHPDLIEEVFEADEWVFDADKLAARLMAQMEHAGVELSLESEALRVRGQGGGRMELSFRRGGTEESIGADFVFNTSYSRINKLLVDSGRPPVPLKHEFTEMALVEVPPILSQVGITVMCGPFFSLMPFPLRKLHTLSHVRYTPHHEWFDGGNDYRDAYDYFDRVPRRSDFVHMRHDARRFVPAIEECRYVDSLWEVKTVLPESEVDDSRPILFQRDAVLPNLISIMGSKIDNAYDMMESVAKVVEGSVV